MSGTVLVHHAVANRFDELVDQCRDQPEQGGILLGAYREQGLEVVALTEAAPSDERALTRFVRQDPAHQAAATAAWRASGGQLTMVGEWHTHPFGEPEPSPTDLGTWSAAVRRSRLPLLFVIVAPGRWRAFRGTRRMMKLRLVRLGGATAGQVGVLLLPAERQQEAWPIGSRASREAACPHRSMSAPNVAVATAMGFHATMRWTRSEDRLAMTEDNGPARDGREGNPPPEASVPNSPLRRT